MTSVRSRLGLSLAMAMAALLTTMAQATTIVPGSPMEGREVMQRVKDSDSSNDSSRVMTMSIQRNGGERVRRMISLKRNLDGWSQSLTRFEKPEDVRNTAFLSWSYDDTARDDDMWMYLPASGLLRRISGSGKKGSFMGSDLANEDIEDRAIDDDSHTFQGWVPCGDTQCVSIESVPRNKKESNYSRRISLVRSDIWQVVHADYFDLSGHLLKTAELSDFVENGGIWSAGRMVVETPREKSRTVIQYSDIMYNIGLNEERFVPQSIKR